MDGGTPLGAPPFWMAVSRILSGPRLAPGPGRPFVLPRPCGRDSPFGLRLIPGGHLRLAPRDRAGNPVPPVLSCTAWGFSCPRTCARGGGLLPRLFTLSARLAPGGGLFSVTLSVERDLGPFPPRILRGMLPFGVRTFLSPPPCGLRRTAVRHRLEPYTHRRAEASGR